MKRLSALLLCLLLLAGCSSGGTGDTGVTEDFFAMDTVMKITAYDGDKDAVTAAVQEVNTLEALFSRTRTESEISAVNAASGSGKSIKVSETTFSILDSAVAFSKRTGDAFDITIAPVMDAWGFTKGEYRVPSQEELDALLPLVDDSLLEMDSGTFSVCLPKPGMAIDLGAIAKGFTANRVLEVLAAHKVTSAIVNLGGNISVLGTKTDGSDWRVAVRDPKDSESYVCVLTLTDKTLSTSGGYERYFEENGKTYHHIIDPKTGYPAETGLTSVTVVSSSGATADALSTACFVLGEDKALELWRSSSDFELVLVREDGKVLVTEGLEKDLDTQGGNNGYTFEIVRR
ncbi:FAD:protein FMN transferase [bioreactor metagenome]|uniref:FAD:protein FMN transferase n=1 Tax=bioreactor metagenome TaxID=1076179 RepID=A0A644YBR3_9ZZZZ